MGNLTIATIFIVLINVLMWFSAIAIDEINPGGTQCYHVEGSIIGASVTDFSNNDFNNTIIQNDVENQLPAAQGTVSAGTSTNIFTDIFNSVLSWFKSAPGVKYIYSVVAAPANILNCTTLPIQFKIGIGVLWYLVSLLTLVAFLWGRD